MKDSAKAVKDAYLNLLSGAITYNGSAIDVVDEESIPEGNDFYVIVSSVTDTQLLDNKNEFHNECTIVIDVVAKYYGYVSKPHEIVDGITSQILQLVIPSLTTTGLTSTDFQFKRVVKESSQHLPIQDNGVKRVMRRVTRFSHILIEL